MAISNHERVGKALSFLSQGLYPYVEREMKAVHRERWLTVATSHLSDEPTLKRNPVDIIREDVSALLTVMLRQWDKVFKIKKNLGYAERALVSELIEVRNKWAHQSRFFTDDTYRALDSIARLLKAISASEAIDVEKQKQEVLRILSQEQDRSETRPASVEESRIRERLDELLKKLPFQDASYLNWALTHRSYIFENPNSGEDNERLEFLGDAVLNFLSGEYLYRRYPEMREGEMTPLRSRLVDKPQLAKFSTDLGIGKWMRLGKGAETDGGRTSASFLSNTFEAIIGAYFLDSGIEAVRDFMELLFTEAIKNPIFPESHANSNNFVDPKTQFQQWALANIDENPQRQVPKYITDRSGGTDNAPEFIAKVVVGEQEWGEGKGCSKKDAEKAAAEAALAKLKNRGLM
jgi:ribonuclease-3